MRARRSCLSVPARPSRKLEKASEISADEVVVDLENSVPVELKDKAQAARAEGLLARAGAAEGATAR
jgi:citrate lyase beta subunit